MELRVTLPRRGTSYSPENDGDETQTDSQVKRGTGVGPMVKGLTTTRTLSSTPVRGTGRRSFEDPPPQGHRPVSLVGGTD